MLQYWDIAILGTQEYKIETITPPSLEYCTSFPATHLAKSLRRQLLKSDGTSSLLVLL